MNEKSKPKHKYLLVFRDKLCQIVGPLLECLGMFIKSYKR